MTSRTDLLELTDDDLVTLSNRGIVKRARQEIEEGAPTLELEESGGSLAFTWSDGVVCRFPAGKGVREASCSCPSTAMCRHRIRSVLAYQAASAAVPRAAEPWDPGTIADEQLATHFSAASLRKARAQFDDGHVVELLRAAKPSALLHTVPAQVRFLVPHDLRYTHCDCSETPPCVHVAIAIWSFRLLAADAAAGVVSTRTAALEVPEALLAAMETLLVDLASIGFAAVPRSLLDRARRLEGQARDEGLVWPAEVLADMLEQIESYAAHDARFSAETFARLAGELCIRIDAIRGATAAVPQPFVRGMRSDHATDVGTARLIGVGCNVETARAGVTLSALLQDSGSGAVVAVSRFRADVATDFAALGQVSVKGMPLASIGAGQVLARGGKRTAGGRFSPSKALLHPQSYQWEQLRAPLRMPGVAELRAHLESQPIAALRPRRVSDRLHVLATKRNSDVHFDQAEQMLIAHLRDAEDESFRVVLRYASRAAAGFEALLQLLSTAGDSIRFVSGYVTLAGGGVTIEPIAVVYETEGGRAMLQPLVAASATASATTAPPSDRRPPGHPLHELRARLTAAVGDTFVAGLPRSTASLWTELAAFAHGIGALRIGDAVASFAEALDRTARTARPDLRPPALALLRLAVLAEVANEM